MKQSKLNNKEPSVLGSSTGPEDKARPCLPFKKVFKLIKLI